MVRTEEAKRLRKDYEAHKIKHGFNEFRVAEPRKDGISNTISTVQKDTLVLEQMRIRAIDEQNMKVRDKTFGTIQTDGSSPKHNNRVLEENSMEIQRVGQISNDGSQYGTVLSEKGLSATLAAETHGYANNCIATEEVDKYRIRKLTPREAFRLMDLTDEEFDRAQKVASNTALYKAAGNGLVPNCIIGIIGQMIDGKENAYKRSVDNFGDSVDND